MTDTTQTPKERALQRLDKWLELYRLYQDRQRTQQAMIRMLHDHNAFEPGYKGGGMDGAADDLMELIDLNEATLAMNERWIRYGERKLCIGKPKPTKDHSHLSVVH